MDRKKFFLNIISLNFLKTFTNFLLGFLTGLVLLIFGLKIISSAWGAVIGLIMSFSASAYLLKKHRNNGTLKLMAIGMLSASVLIVICYLILSILLWSMFQGIAD
jgi:hypothetical protein